MELERLPDSSDSATTKIMVPPTSAEKLKKRPGGSLESEAPHKATKRRAARACVSCRARKVRCDVVEGAPCGNCRWDNVECVVQESRRRKKNLAATVIDTVGQNSGALPAAEAHHQQQQQLRCKVTPTDGNTSTSSSSTTTASRSDLRNNNTIAGFTINNSTAGDEREDVRRRRRSDSILSSSSLDAGVDLLPGATVIDNENPNIIYRRNDYHGDSVLLNTAGQHPRARQFVVEQDVPSPWSQHMRQQPFFEGSRTAQYLTSLNEPRLSGPGQLPGFLRPLPQRIDAEDVCYLRAKGALDLPDDQLQKALLQAYAEYVHPYMPLIDLYDFLSIVNGQDGRDGQTSLLLYQAIMFSSTPFVSMRHLREAGFSNRKAARKAFFQKARLLYDFDYESDRLVLVQALMLMTYWYETPDDQKDTWHWMGVAISLAHTIGLHRNPVATGMENSKKKLWKRVWWSCFMRDRLVALGMRRPTRIQDEEFDVPMLEESDFEIQVLPGDNTVIPVECSLLRDETMQRELAQMCIKKAQLCLCISRMLRTQYSVLIRDNMKPENTTNSTMMLFPNKTADNVESVNEVDEDLARWMNSLPKSCQYRAIEQEEVKQGRSTLAVQRTLLHMVYYTTISALHRPLFLPSSPHNLLATSRDVQELSRLKVRAAATHITQMAAELHHSRLEKYLPTTGVTVILPAMIIHLLEMKSADGQNREQAIRGFRQCKRVMEKLREAYAAADYATGFLEAALRKAGINIHVDEEPMLTVMKSVPVEFSAQTPPPESSMYMPTTGSLLNERLPQMKRPMLPPNTASPADLELSANSPPETDFDSTNEGLTPNTSGGSDALMDLEALDLDFMQGHDEFDWNAVAGTDFDVDQWLQFPPEGSTNPAMTSGNINTGDEKVVEPSLDWAINADAEVSVQA